MKTNVLLASLAAASGLLALATPNSRAATVYANQTAPANYTERFNPGGSEVGDEIKLGGPVTGGPMADYARLTSFQFDMWASGYTGKPVIQGQVRFYANDGPLIGAAHQPGTLLWDSALFPIQLQMDDTSPIPGPATITQYNILFTTDVAGVIVPQDFTWSVQFSDLQGGRAGPILWTPPTVGNNYQDYWLNTGAGWSLQGGVPPVWDFAGSFEGIAVPEPAPMLSMGCVVLVGGFLAWRRRAKASATA